MNENLNVEDITPIKTPACLKAELPLSAPLESAIAEYRKTIENILQGRDSRLLVVIGPCSIHDPKAALDYACRLKQLSMKPDLASRYFFVMRVYFEKPRSTVGWKGLINDPDQDDSFDVEKGLRIARSLMLDITAMGLPIATEALDPVSPQYLSDLISWSAIGARTTESQTHREMASGLSYPVGFKNGTDGSITVALNAMVSSSKPHAFLGINSQGAISRVKTKGNSCGHVILRGGSDGPNYDSVCVSEVLQCLADQQLNPYLMVDCSHGNSRKNHLNQILVFKDVMSQRAQGNDKLAGVMIESFIEEGNQKKPEVYGKSITDACLSWDQTESLFK